MPKRVEMVWNAYKSCSYGALISMDLADFLQVWNCAKLHDLESLTVCGGRVTHRTSLFFGQDIDLSACYKSAKNNWNICRDGPFIASQNWRNGAIDRLRDIAQCRKFDRLWQGRFPSCTLNTSVDYTALSYWKLYKYSSQPLTPLQQILWHFWLTNWQKIVQIWGAYLPNGGENKKCARLEF